MRVESAQVIAFDFGDIDEIESYICEISDGDDPLSMYDDEAYPPMREFMTEINNIRAVEDENNSFNTLYVSVFRFGSIPDAAALMLRGDVSEYSSDTASVLDSRNLQDELRDIWLDHFDDFPSGMSINSPETIMSGQIAVDDLTTLFQMTDHGKNVGSLRNYRPFVESVRDESFCRSLGIEFLGMMSVDVHRDEFLMLTAETVRRSTGDQVEYGRYAVLEFLPEGSMHRSISELETDAVPPMGPCMSVNRMKQMIAPLFYHHWLQERSRYRKQYLRNELRNIPRTIRDSDEMSSVIESVQDARTKFYTTYTKFLNKADSAEDMLDRIGDIAMRESGVPLLPTQTPSVRSDIESMKFDSGNESGILALLTTDIRSRLENETRQYELMKERYDIVFEEMDQKFDLEIARKNKNISESSIALQKEVRILNWLVVFLTIILAGKEVGSVLGVW